MSTTVAAAILDPRSEWRWLLALSYRGAVYRFATEASDYGGFAWRRGMAVTGEPEARVDPYSATAEVMQAGIELYPVPDDPTDATPTRPCDIGAGDASAWQRMSAVLYRWPVGGTDAQEILRGVVAEPQIAPSGTVSFTLEDFTGLYNKRLSPATVQASEYSDVTLPEDEHGVTFPVLFGTFVDSRCPVVNEASPYAVVACSLGDPDFDLGFGDVTVELGGAADAVVTQTAATNRGSDARWNVVITSDPTDKTVTAAGSGIKDDSGGTFTGVANATISHPADQLHCLARVYAGIPASLVDAPSFVAMRGALAGWVFSIMQEAGATDGFFDVAAEVCYWLRSVVMHERGKLRIRDLDFARAPVLPLVLGGNVSRRGGIEWGSIEDEVASKIELAYRYQYDLTRDEYAYAGSRVIDGTNGTYDLSANEEIGAGTLTLETRHLYDEVTAHRCGGLIRQLVQLPRLRVKDVVVDRSAHELRIYDTVTLTDPTAPSSDGTGWNEKRLIVIGIRYGLETNTLTLLDAEV